MAKRILAVDDENDVLLIIKTALQSEGFDVQTASNGPEALEKIAEERPDLVILDYMMPGMTGFETLSKIRGEPATANLPVIMLTGISERQKIQEAIASGAEYYIVKPFEFHDLVSKVNTALKTSDEDPFQI